MPELPEVETMVRGIRRDCTGRTIERLEFVRCRKRPIPVFPSRQALMKAVAGRTLNSVSRIAKRVLLELDSGDTLVIEPRMTGLLLVSDPPSLDHRRILWHFHPQPGLSGTLEFWDRRGLGTVSLLKPDQMQVLRERLGPDALTIDRNDLYDRLRSTGREIKVALLDQHLVAGIGNLYASEILHRAHISPLRKSSDLSKREVQRITLATQTILQDAIRYEGSTLNDGTYRNALNQDGSYQNQHRVYQKAGERCANCNRGTIERIVQAQRATFYCPRCQK